MSQSYKAENTENEWKLVINKKKGQKSSRHNLSNSTKMLIDQSKAIRPVERTVVPKMTLSQRRIHLISVVDSLQHSEFYAGFIKTMRISISMLVGRFGETGCDLVSYGLGSFTSRVSIAQLALIILIMKEFDIGQSLIYDPLMDLVDEAILKEYSISKIDKNERAYHPIDARPTIFWMPHCPLGLYDNLIESNFSYGKLEKIMIIGNNFGSYHDRLRIADLAKKAPYVSWIFPYMDISCIKEREQWIVEFSDVAIHLVNLQKLPEVPLPSMKKVVDNEIVN